MLRIAVIDDDKTLLCDMHKLFDRFIIAYDLSMQNSKQEKNMIYFSLTLSFRK